MANVFTRWHHFLHTAAIKQSTPHHHCCSHKTINASIHQHHCIHHSTHPSISTTAPITTSTSIASAWFCFHQRIHPSAPLDPSPPPPPLHQPSSASTPTQQLSCSATNRNTVSISTSTTIESAHCCHKTINASPPLHHCCHKATNASIHQYHCIHHHLHLHFISPVLLPPQHNNCPVLPLIGTQHSSAYPHHNCISTPFPQPAAIFTLTLLGTETSQKPFLTFIGKCCFLPPHSATALQHTHSHYSL
jgi:hypothetical protein